PHRFAGRSAGPLRRILCSSSKDWRILVKNPVSHSQRRGATLVLSAFLMIVMLAMIAFAIDCGYILLLRTQLQVAADSAALAAAQVMGSPTTDPVAKAKEYAAYHKAGGRQIQLNSTDIEYGTWDATTKKFLPSVSLGNAMRITTRLDASHG